MMPCVTLGVALTTAAGSWLVYLLTMGSASAELVQVFLGTSSLFMALAIVTLSWFRFRVLREAEYPLLRATFATTAFFQLVFVAGVVGIHDLGFFRMVWGEMLAVSGLWVLYRAFGVTFWLTAPLAIVFGVASFATPAPGVAAYLGIAFVPLAWTTWSRCHRSSTVLRCCLVGYAVLSSAALLVASDPRGAALLIPQFLFAAAFLPPCLSILIDNVVNFASMHRHSRFISSVVEHIPSMIFVKDAKELRFEMFNTAGEQLIGMDRGELLGKNDFDFFPEEQAESFVAKDREVLTKKKMLDIPEEPLETKQGTRWLHTRKVPVLSAQGEPLFLIGISDDITEARRLKADLAETQVKAVQQAKMASLGQMAAGMAHEINNPLHIILGGLDRVEKMIAQGANADELNARFKKLNATCHRIGRIVEALRNYARDVSDAPKTQVSVADLLEDTLSLCGERFRVNGIDVRVEGNQELEVRCRPVEMSQVLLNLLNNAFDALEELDEKWVEIRTKRVADRLVIRVRDSGTGLDASHIDRLTEPFFTTKPVGKGTGLGLSISRGLVEGHGGMLYLDGEDDHTCFVVSIPGLVFRKTEAA